MNKGFIRIASCCICLFAITACSSPKKGPVSSISGPRVIHGGSSYSGGYEPGERAYAEREAARLNRQQSLRLRAGGLFR